MWLGLGLSICFCWRAGSLPRRELVSLSMVGCMGRITLLPLRVSAVMHLGGGVLAGDVASVTERPGEVRGYVWFSLGVVLGDSKNSGKQVHHSILTWGVRHPWLFPCAQVDPGDGHPKSRRIVLKTSCESTMKSVHCTRTRSIVSDTGLFVRLIESEHFLKGMVRGRGVERGRGIPMSIPRKLLAKGLLGRGGTAVSKLVFAGTVRTEYQRRRHRERQTSLGVAKLH